MWRPLFEASGLRAGRAASSTSVGRNPASVLPAPVGAINRADRPARAFSRSAIWCARGVHPRAELERSFREAWLPAKPMGPLATVYKPHGRYIGRCGVYPHRGDDDQIVPINDSAMLSSKLIKNAQLKVYQGAPHGLCSTEKDKVNGDLLEFLKS